MTAPIRCLASCLAIASLAPPACSGGETAADSLPTPPPRVLALLRAKHDPGDWLFVSTPEGRLEVRAVDIGADGLTGLRGRRGAEPVGPGLSWARIGRIEHRVSSFRAGQAAGLVLGALVGGYGFSSLDEGSDADTWLAMPLGAFAGAWIGSRLGDRRVRAETWYAVEPSVAPSDTAPAPSGPATAAHEPARALARVRALTRPRDVLRVRGPFGQFCGRAATRDERGLSGLAQDPRLDTAGEPPPVIPWEQVSSVERRGNSSGPLAAAGAFVVGSAAAALGGAIAGMSVGLSTSGGDSGDILGGVALGALTGGIVGAGAGALLGTAFPRWQGVYRARTAPPQRR